MFLKKYFINSYFYRTFFPQSILDYTSPIGVSATGGSQEISESVSGNEVFPVDLIDQYIGNDSSGNFDTDIEVEGEVRV
jgi:hypothetical protein